VSDPTDEGEQAPKWRPLRWRDVDDGGSWDVLYEGLPGHLRPGVEAWLTSVAAEQSRVGRVERALRLDWATGKPSSFLFQISGESDDVWLDVLDAFLRQLQVEYDALDGRNPDDREGRAWRRMRAVRLKVLLVESASAWEVGTEPFWGLVRRVSDEMQQAARAAMSPEDDAASQLRRAWAACFRREPDYDETYRRAVLAVESVATSFLTPNDPKPSLGKAITHLADTPGRYTVAGLDSPDISSQDALVAMLRLLWHNHQRHVARGGASPSDVNRQEAEAALFASVTLVQWFRHGLVTAQTSGTGQPRRSETR
jgi:hypothetical protein